jgi:hypothetical protein
MKGAEVSIDSPGRTFLKSTQHIRVRETKGSYARSIAVGLQFGIIHLPYEIVSVVIWPFVRNIATVLFTAASDLIFVLSASWAAIHTGFTGVLEATDEPIIVELDEE